MATTKIVGEIDDNLMGRDTDDDILQVTFLSPVDKVPNTDKIKWTKFFDPVVAPVRFEQSSGPNIPGHLERPEAFSLICSPTIVFQINL